MIITVLSAASVSLGMDRHRTAFKLSGDQQKVIRIIESHRRNEEQKNRKLLEHACFKGESLRFQNEFFASDYTALPRQQSVINYVILRDESDLRATFAYHQHYRKHCSIALEKVEEYVAFKQTHAPCGGIVLKINGVQLNAFGYSLGQHSFVLEKMRQAWKSHDYPVMLLILEEIASSNRL